MEKKVEVTKEVVGNECKVIPGPRGWPLLGNLSQLDTRNLQMTFYNWKLEYGPIFQFSMLGNKFVVLNDVNVFQNVFGNTIMRSRPEDSFYKMFNFKGRGVTLSNYKEEDVIVKQICQKIFHDVLRDDHLQTLVNSEVDTFIEQICSGEDVNLESVVLSCIERMFSIEILGNKPNVPQSSVVHEYLCAVIDIFAEGREFLLTMHPWVRFIPGSTRNAFLRITRAKERLIPEFEEPAKSTYVEGQEHGLIHRFWTQQKLQNEKAKRKIVDDEQVYATCLTEIIAGAFVGTSRNLTVCFVGLLHNPEIYDKIKVEIVKVLGNEKNVEDIRYDDLPYVRAYVMECIRFAGIIHITLPHYVDKDLEVGGYRFEKGMTVLGSTWNVHHDEKVWGDPWTFRPERFLDDSGNLLPETDPIRKAFLPFGVGERSCKGKDLAMRKILQIFVHVLYLCEILPPKDLKKLPENDPRKYVSVVGLTLPKWHCRFAKKK